MIPAQTALAPDFSKVPVVPVQQPDGSTINDYKFDAYIVGGRYKVGQKLWDVRAWNVFTPEEYRPWTVAPTNSFVNVPLLPVPIPIDPATLCDPQLADRLFKEIGIGEKIEATPYGAKATPTWDAKDSRRYFILRVPGGLQFDFGQLLADRMAQGVDPTGWGAPGHWNIQTDKNNPQIITGIGFVFDPPSEPVAKPTDWVPARLMTADEQARFASELEGDVLLDSSDSPMQAGRGDFTPEDRARLIHIEHMLEQLTGAK